MRRKAFVKVMVVVMIALNIALLMVLYSFKVTADELSESVERFSETSKALGDYAEYKLKQEGVEENDVTDVEDTGQR